MSVERAVRMVFAPIGAVLDKELRLAFEETRLVRDASKPPRGLAGVPRLERPATVGQRREATRGCTMTPIARAASMTSCRSSATVSSDYQSPTDSQLDAELAKAIAEQQRRRSPEPPRPGTGRPQGAEARRAKAQSRSARPQHLKNGQASRPTPTLSRSSASNVSTVCCCSQGERLGTTRYVVVKRLAPRNATLMPGTGLTSSCRRFHRPSNPVSPSGYSSNTVAELRSIGRRRDFAPSALLAGKGR
jgi:hypothetical protein